MYCGVYQQIYILVHEIAKMPVVSMVITFDESYLKTVEVLRDNGAKPTDQEKEDN